MVNPEQVADLFQGLANATLERERHVYNVVFGAATGDASFSWSGAAGFADPAAGIPMRPDTPFLLASITKTFTAAAALTLQERGLLRLGDRLSEHLPEDLLRGLHHRRGRDHTSSLTVRHLIAQTSGLADYFLEKPRGGRSVLDRILSEGDRPWDLEDVVGLTREGLPARFPPQLYGDGEGRARTRLRAHYSDTNYKLLGAVIESAAGAPLHAVFEELFFDPLGLDETYFFGRPRSGATGELAQVFYKDRPFMRDKLLASHGPEGGLVSTVGDTLRFGRALMSGELFARPETLASMRHWNRIFFPFEYGYGLMRFKIPRILSPIGYNPELVGHSGSSGSFLYYCEDLDLYLCGTVNQLARQGVPFSLMIKAAQAFRRASRGGRG